MLIHKKSPSLDEEMAPDSKTTGFKVEVNVSNTHKNIQVHVKLVHIVCDKKYHVLITVAETEPYNLFRWGKGYSCEDPLKDMLQRSTTLETADDRKGLVCPFCISKAPSLLEMRRHCENEHRN